MTSQDSWGWDGAGWTLLSPGNMPSARLDAAVSYDRRRKEVVLFDGFNLDGETWEYGVAVGAVPAVHHLGLAVIVGLTGFLGVWELRRRR